MQATVQKLSVYIFGARDSTDSYSVLSQPFKKTNIIRAKCFLYFNEKSLSFQLVTPAKIVSGIFRP